MLEPAVSTVADLRLIVNQTTALGTFLGNKMAVGKPLNDEKFVNCIKEMLSLAGILLYRAGIRKENYMEDLPYLFGQLLKASDELHTLYCRVVRGGNLPTQLAGSGMYRSAAEYPVRTLNMLGTRMNPYITWAKSYRTKNENANGKESWRAAWLLSLYENIASDLHKAWKSDIHFGDAEKAQLFIGYLANFPKKENAENKKLTEDLIDEQ